MRRADAVLCLSLAVLAGAARVRAQATPSVSLDWQAPAGCPSESEVLKRIRKLAHVWPPTGTPLRAEATITRTGEEQLHLRLIVRAGGLVGERNIDAKACANLASAAAIHVALLLNQATPLNERDLSSPERATDTGSATSETAPTSVTVSDAEPGATEAQANRDAAGVALEPAQEPTGVESSSTRNWRVLVQAPLASAQLGPLPRPNFGVSLAAGVGIANWRFLADGRVWMQQRLEFEDDPRFGADVDHIDVGVRVCRAFVWNSFELAPCVRVSVEHVWARGTGAHVAPETAAATWGAFGLGAQARVSLLDWLSLVAGVDAQLEAARPQISIDGVGSLGKLGPAAVALTLGSEWIF